MTDHLTKRQRSKNMSNIKSKDTKPEIAVRKALTELGMRYRLHKNKLPGKPDIVNESRNMAVFINGCFWHQHNGCKRKSMPKSNKDYWKPKLEKNVERQKKQIKELKMLGYEPLIIWECETQDISVLTQRLKRNLL